MKFKRISAVLGSVLMATLSIAGAAAASFPAPFVKSGVADVAIVYGSGAGVSSLDQTYAGNIQTTLAEAMPTTGGTVTGGESYKFEKTSTKFHLGDHYVNLTQTLDEDELPTLLAPGKYIDDDNDEISYTQKVTMGSLGQLTMFDDNDYAEDSPTVGFRLPSAQTILTYQIDFSDTLLVTDMPTTELPLMGKSFYVLSNTTDTLTLLDSAASGVVSQGETVNLNVDGKSYAISVSIFDTTNSKVKLSINGEITNLLGNTDTQRLSSGAYLGIKSVVANAYQGGSSQVEFSIGSGKLKLTDGGSEVQINDQAVSGLTADFDLTANVLSKINITWAADDDIFVTEDNEETMPGFGGLKLSYGGLNYPLEEVITVKNGGDAYLTLDNFPLKDGEVGIHFLYGNTTSFTDIGKSATKRLHTDANNDGNITFNRNNDEAFIVSWTDTKDAESYYLRANNFVLDGSSIERFDLEQYKSGSWSVIKSSVKATDTISIGSVDLTVGAVDRSGKTVEIWKTNEDTETSITSFNTLYSKEGLTIYLPWLNTTATNITGAAKTAVTACEAVQGKDQVGELGFAGVVTYNGSAGIADDHGMWQNTTTCVIPYTTFALKIVEEDRSGNKYSGDHFNLTLGWDSSTTPKAEVSDVVGEDVAFVEIGETDVWRSFMYSALATELLWDKPSSGQKSIKIMYHGDEVMADVFITSPEASIGGTSTLGNVLVKDSEVASVSSKNLIIVGGSCINSAAATALGVADHTCGAAFTAATGVNAGQFLIQSVDGAFASGKIALVVAGYDVTDTNNAATYLRTQTVDTTAGNKYVGTTATTATLQVNN